MLLLSAKGNHMDNGTSILDDPESERIYGALIWMGCQYLISGKGKKSALVRIARQIKNQAIAKNVITHADKMLKVLIEGDYSSLPEDDRSAWSESFDEAKELVLLEGYSFEESLHEVFVERADSLDD